MDESSEESGENREAPGPDAFWLTVTGEFIGSIVSFCTVCRVSPIDDERRCLLAECPREMARERGMG